MPAYLVTRPAGSASGPFPDGADAMVVFAKDAADAKAICKAQYNYDADAAWTGATVTEVTKAADLAGFTLELTIRTATPKHFVVTGVAGDQMEDLAAALVTAINADGDLADATYTAATRVLNVPGTNNVGDKVFVVALKRNGVAIPSLAPALNAAGAANAARTLTMAASTLAGSTLRVTVADDTNPVDVSLTADVGETLDVFAARMVVALNATTLLSNVTYTDATQVLLIPGATDGQGDKAIVATFTSAGGYADAHFQPAVNAVGVAAADRTITLPADAVVPFAYPIPAVLAAVKTV